MNIPERKIVKAEILLSRQCPLSCSYCGMKSEKQNTRTVEDWKKGMLELYKLGCEFIAFYGAEPLTEFDKLTEVIRFCEVSLGIDTTIITSGAVPNFLDKIVALNENGARSLSMSYDPKPIDKSSAFKSAKALETLKAFSKLGNVRDVAAIATLTAKNYMFFPDMVRKMTEHGIWSFFDLIHTDRGQPGTKCKNVSEDLLFQPKHYAGLKLMFTELKYLKSIGCLCHTSEHFMNMLMDDMDYGSGIYEWTCSNQEPSWVTIDCDGHVLPCDDFCGNANIDMTEIYSKWDEFCKKTTHSVKHHD